MEKCIRGIMAHINWVFHWKHRIAQAHSPILFFSLRLKILCWNNPQTYNWPFRCNRIECPPGYSVRFLGIIAERCSSQRCLLLTVTIAESKSMPVFKVGGGGGSKETQNFCTLVCKNETRYRVGLFSLTFNYTKYNPIIVCIIVSGKPRLGCEPNLKRNVRSL